MNKNELIIKRVMDAPKQLVFEAFTQVEHLAHWWGPAGFVIDVISFDLSVNGKFHYGMKSPDGNQMYGLFKYVEINSPDKLVFNSSFADKDGNLIKPPFLDSFPLEIQNTWIFAEEDGKTTITLTGVPLATNEMEFNAFKGMHDNMNKGFNGTFDQLENYISAKFKLRNQLKKNNRARVCTYLNFPGNTEEAFNFYKSVFGGDFQGQGFQRFGDIPAQEGMPPMSDADKKLILHVEIEILGGHMLMATDAPESMGFKVEIGNNMHISLEPETKVETKKIFDALSKGGKVSMDLQDMFWGAYFGSCTDKYGINWMFNCLAKE